MADSLLNDGELHELKLGQSFESDGRVAYHSMYFDFKPASIDTVKPAVIDIEKGNKVTVTVPHVEESSTKQTVYCGSKQPCQKDYALIINHDTGEIVLEKMTYKLNLKRTRAEKPKDLRGTLDKHAKVSGENVSVVAVAARNGNAPSPTGDIVTKSLSKPNDLSGSSSSEAESSSGDSCDSSDSENDAPAPASRQPSPPATNTFNICDDLQLSESESDSE